MDGREDNFLATVKDWKTFMTKNDGFIPEDPYRGLLASSPDWTFNSLRDVYFAPYLPPRLNPDVSKNPRYVVFSYRPSFPNRARMTAAAYGVPDAPDTPMTHGLRSPMCPRSHAAAQRSARRRS